MKNRKTILKTFCLVLAVVFTLFCLTSCDMLSGLTGGGTSESGKNSGSGTKTSKIDFAEAAENFDKKDVKKTEIELKLKGSLFINPSVQQDSELKLNLKDSYNFGSTVDVERIQNKEKVYVGAGVSISDTDIEVSGLLDGILMTLDKKEYKDLLKENADVIKKYVTTLHHYFTGQISLSSELGTQNGVYNLKARYADKENGEKGDIWLVADDEALVSWLNNNSKAEVTSDLIKSYMMKTMFSGLTKKSSYYEKDNASKYVDKDGNSEYSIKIKTNEINVKEKTEEIVSSSVISALLELVGANDFSETIDRYKEYFTDIQDWFSLEVSDVKAVCKDSLPLNVKTSMTLDLNIDVVQVRSIIDKLYKDRAITYGSMLMSKGVVNVVNNFLCGTDKYEGSERTNRIGIRLSAELNENFITDASKCKLSGDKYADYFIGIDEKPEGRTDLRNIVAGIIDDVEKYVDDYLRTFGSEYADEVADIRAKILEKITALKESGTEVIDVDIMQQILQEVLAEYAADEPTEEQGESETDGDDNTSGQSVDKEKSQSIINGILDQFGKKN